MKNLIAIAILFTSVFASAQVKNIEVTGTFFKNGIDSKTWSNKTSDEATSSKFKDYTGESYLVFVASKDTKLKIDYSVALSQGQADVVFSAKDEADSSGPLFLQIEGSGTSKDSKTVDLKAGVEYRLVLRGTDAKGSFSSKWTEL